MTMAQQDLFIDSKVEEVTPQQAALWLEAANIRNRPLQMTRCQAIAGAISRGEWWLNGDAIRFCTSGQLLDGQHRLQAIVLAGKPVKTLVVRGLHPDSFTTIDTNCKSRTAADVLSLAGMKNCNVLASTARLAFGYHKYGNPYETAGEKAPSVDQVMEQAMRPEIQAATNAVISYKWCKKYLALGVSAFCFYAFHQYRPDHAVTFFEKLETGAGLEDGSPILQLRDRLVMDNNSTARLPAMVKAAFVFKAWRLYLLGANVTYLKSPVTKGVSLRAVFAMERLGNEGSGDRR